MNIRLTYVMRELLYSLRRNSTLFIATLVTVTVSLTTLGGGLLVREAVKSATSLWQGDIEFIVFMNPEASGAQDEAIRARLTNNPEISVFRYFDQEAAFKEFQELFEDSPELIENVTVDVLPPSYRVVPVNSDAYVIEALADQFRTQPGVRRVVLATDVIRALQDTSNAISTFVLIMSLALLVAAFLLVFNTIRTAIFARRREIEVMRLVGASNVYIRFPFLVEGTLQGLVGGLLSLPILWFANSQAADFADPDALRLLQGFIVDNGTVLNIGLGMVAVGAVIGAFSSMIAITRFLDV